MRLSTLAIIVFSSMISLGEFQDPICISDATNKEWCKNKSEDLVFVKRDDVSNENMSLKVARDCDPSVEDCCNPDVEDCCNPDVEDCGAKRKSSNVDNTMKTALTMGKPACSLDRETCCDTHDCCEEIDCQAKKKSLFEKMREASEEKIKFQELHLKAAENLIGIQNAQAEQNLKAAKFLIDIQSEQNSKKF